MVTVADVPFCESTPVHSLNVASPTVCGAVSDTTVPSAYFRVNGVVPLPLPSSSTGDTVTETSWPAPDWLTVRIHNSSSSRVYTRVTMSLSSHPALYALNLSILVCPFSSVTKNVPAAMVGELSSGSEPSVV